MTDTDSEKLDKIMWKLERIGEGLAGLAISVQNLVATLQVKRSPEPPPAPPKQP